MASIELTVVIPAYNEELRLGSTLDKVVSYLAKAGQTWEVLVVDDGSRDGTARLVKAFGEAHPGVRLVSNGSNRGKGYTVKNGVMEAVGNWILVSDADLSSPIEEIERLWPMARQGYEVVIGSRDIVGSMVEVPQPLHRRVMGYTFMVLRDWIAVSGFRDTQCGFKLFQREAARDMFARARINGFCFDVELLAIGRMLGRRMCEVPVIWRNDERTTVNPIGDPIKMFLDLFRIRWNMMRGVYGGSGRSTRPGA